MAKTYKIAVMPGDGTGPEVIAEAVKVLQATAAKFKFKTDLTTFDFGGERYKRFWRDAADRRSRNASSMILLGAIGHPDVAPGFWKGFC
jgi:3-isopropylmalate dehydrogenase